MCNAYFLCHLWYNVTVNYEGIQYCSQQQMLQDTLKTKTAVDYDFVHSVIYCIWIWVLGRIVNVHEVKKKYKVVGP
jgi:hypothetical protein